MYGVKLQFEERISRISCKDLGKGGGGGLGQCGVLSLAALKTNLTWTGIGKIDCMFSSWELKHKYDLERMINFQVAVVVMNLHL